LSDRTREPMNDFETNWIKSLWNLKIILYALTLSSRWILWSVLGLWFTSRANIRPSSFALRNRGVTNSSFVLARSTVVVLDHVGIADEGPSKDRASLEVRRAMVFVFPDRTDRRRSATGRPPHQNVSAFRLSHLFLKLISYLFVLIAINLSNQRISFWK
jgi:hypothetical protein